MGRSDIILERANLLPEEAMPLGNGRLGVAVWSADGLTMQLNRADTLPARLSPGQVVIPGLLPLVSAADYHGRLDLYDGVFIESGGGMRAAIYVAPDKDTVTVDVYGADPTLEQTVLLRLWKPRAPSLTIQGETGWLAETWKDDRLPGASHQQFGSLAAVRVDARRVSLTQKDPSTIQAHFLAESDGHFRIIIGSPHFDGREPAQAIAESSVSSAGSYAVTSQWWHAIWQRAGLIKVTSSDGSGEYEEALRTLFLFTAVAENRGTFPGSQAGVADLFSSIGDLHRWDPAGYWHWNLRMQVAAHLEAGLPELNEPYFRLYRQNLPAIEAWTSMHWAGRPGGCVPETMRFNGNGIIFEQAGPLHKKDVLSSNCDQASAPYYNARTLSTGAEVSLWIWNQYLATGDRTFLKENFPVMRDAAQFLLSYERRRGDALRHTEPSNAHETQWDTDDPTTDLAARRALYDVTLQAAALNGLGTPLMSELKDHLRTIPDFPRTQEDHPTSLLSAADDAGGHDVIAESYRPAQQNKNYENIGLEPVWPYEIIDDQSPLFDLAKRTYFSRPFKTKEDWSFDPIQAAQLGLGDELRSTLTTLTQRYQKFPNGFSSWGGADGEFYVEQIAIVAAALPMALVQEHRGVLIIAPSVPHGWNMEGAVSVSGRTRVDVQVQEGNVSALVIEAGTNKHINMRNPWPTADCIEVQSGTDAARCATQHGSILSFSTVSGVSYSLWPHGVQPPPFEVLGGRPAETPKQLGEVHLGLSKAIQPTGTDRAQ